MSIIHYKHHDYNVAVDEEKRGKHRDNCLCYKCERFNPTPSDPKNNCRIAQILFSVCLAFGITTVMWECPAFMKKIIESGGSDES